jgi:CMP-N-acetylneuraminic acid synthetase
MSILGVIPARGGSKGIPKKNLMPFSGKPLIYWSIQAALDSKLLTEFIVSTENSEISAASRDMGAEVLTRPDHLATDGATTMAVLQHVIQERLDVDAVLLMQPTSPIRSFNLIDQVIEAYNENKSNIDSVATGFFCRYWEWGSQESNLPRQINPGYFYDDGNLYILRREDILSNKWCGARQLRIAIDTIYHYEIDDRIEAIAAEAVMDAIKSGVAAPLQKRVRIC